MRIFFIFLTLIYSKSLFSKEINLQFEIDWKSVHLADIEWDISLNKDNYSIDFVIQSYGMTDKIFKYKSVTNIEGLIENNQLHPLTYKSKTKSTKQDIYANLSFSPEGQILEFDIYKEMKECSAAIAEAFGRSKCQRRILCCQLQQNISNIVLHGVWHANGLVYMLGKH